MKSINDFINENNLINECYKQINEEFSSIKLPYTFDIYNEGPKNKDYKITKSNIYKIFFSIDKKEEFDRKDGVKVVKFVDSHSQMIRLPLPADKITYKIFPNKETTKDWTEIPDIQEYTWAGVWYSDKSTEYNYSKYNNDWNEWFKMIKSLMKGKISVTIDESGEKDDLGDKILEIKLNNAEKFYKDREDKIKELQDLNNLKLWAEEAGRKEKEEIQRRKENEENSKKTQEDWHNWWNSLSDEERLSWTMGYGRGSGKWTGD